MSADISRFLITKDNPRRGIALILGSVFFHGVMNALVKSLTDDYPIAEAVFFRAFFTLIPTFIYVRTTSGFGALRTKNWPGHMLRSLVGVAGMSMMVTAYHLLPMADATAIYFSGPLFVTLFSVLFLKEKVALHLWAALLVGFIGVLIVVRPGGADVNMWGGLAAVAGAVCYGLASVGIRALGKTESAATTTFYYAVQSTILTAFPLFWYWRTPDVKGFLMLSTAGILNGLMQICMTRAYQYAPAAVVSPFGYSSIFLSVLFGFLFWGDVPRWNIYVGGAIVVAAGLFILWREARYVPTELLRPGAEEITGSEK